MVHAQSGSEVQRSSGLRQRRGSAAVLLKGLHPKTGACLGERAPVDLFLHRCGSALAPADALELDPHCAYRMRAVKKGPCLLPLCVVLGKPHDLFDLTASHVSMSMCQLSSLHGGFRGVSGCMGGRS